MAPQPIIETLIAARLRAGLSQSTLGAKVGLAQSHISKIERGAVDVQTSSLVELARALGLELMLVPAQLVPAVQALEREAAPDPRRAPSRIDHDLTRVARDARVLLKRFPELRGLSDIAAAADALRIARLDQTFAAEARRLIDSAILVLSRLRDAARDPPTTGETAVGLDPTLKLNSITRDLINLRNAWDRRQSASRQLPAYQLNESDE
jgi:transcriptional regulator with XRE-family HTH domain